MHQLFRQAGARRARWAVSAAAVVITGAAVAVATVPSASAAPVLPSKTPAQLLADVAGTKTVPALTGTVVETTSLGLPQLPETGDPTSLSSLLTGSHTVKVYWQDARHFRLAVPSSLSETDIIRDDGTAWLWDSSKNAVTKYTLPSDNSKKKMMGTAEKAAAAKAKSAGLPQTAPLTPQQAASEILAKVGKTTVVTTQSNVDVADQAAYQLVLAPKSAESTIRAIAIAIDGKTGVPLRLQVFPKGSATPAFQVGYTSISYTAPSSANFNFTPPSGARVTNASDAMGGSKPSSASPATKPGTYGSGWLAVAELPESGLPGISGTGGPSSAAPFSSSSSSAKPGTTGSSSGTGSSSSTGNPAGGGSQEILGTILGAAKPVSGSWGSGQLLHTSLLNVLITGGKIYVGAVDPSVLEAAVGHTTTSSTGTSSTGAAG